MLLSFMVTMARAAPTVQGRNNVSESRPNDFQENSPASSTFVSAIDTTPTSTLSSDLNKTSTSPTPETTTSGELYDFTSHQNTSTFTCFGKVTGYYADVKLNCRVYHFCTQLDGLDGPSYQRMSYMCMEGSYFDQKDLNCVKESDLRVKCDKAEAEYERSNKQFDAKEESQPSMSDSFAANLMMNPITRFIAGR